MALVNKPDESIFASSAKQGEVDNFPDLLRGWGVTFDQTQGIPPMEWFNFLFKRLDEKHTYLMQRGLPEWSATQDYTKGSCVQFDGVSYRALKDSKNNRPNESESQYWVRWGFTLSEIAQATLTQYGITKLYTGYDSQSEDLASTPKTAYQLKQLIDSNTRALGNVIPNSKKSSAVNSNSADTVATSAAVKTAYDKGVEAKTAADNAQRTANDGVSKANAAQTSANHAKSAADTAQSTANDGVSKANAANNNANGRVSKAGDSLTGILHTVGIASTHFGHGDYSSQYTSGAPFMVEATGSKDRDTYHPFVKGLVRSKGRYGAGFSLGYTTKQGNGDGFGRGIINLIEDNGTSKNWGFEHNGDFYSAGDVRTSSGKSLNTATQFSDFIYQKIGNFEVRKYPDGTMIQTNTVNFRGGYSHGTVYSFNWAVSFVSAPMVFGSSKAIQDFSFVDRSQMDIKTKSNGSTYYYYLYDPGAEQGDWDMQFLAIGRWKR
ncbi:phage tail protein [Haemophilus haemolyticus]|uniref:Phage tail protein n=1 Tax=Haemophilus haemolyticus TaxID=726 RepID=A0A502LMR8_HAEHA|nr:tail fiber protein [Haemophilus haemolyticus]TPH22883.1 phage tail protein [Haemophilus haemolyticus]